MRMKKPDNAIFFTQTPCIENRAGFSSWAEACGITMILIHQAAHGIISSRSLRQGFVSGLIPSRWQNWQKQRLDSVFIERAKKRSAITLLTSVSQINYSLGWNKDKRSHLPKSNSSRGTVYWLWVKLCSWRRRRQWFPLDGASASAGMHTHTHRHSQIDVIPVRQCVLLDVHG